MKKKNKAEIESEIHQYWSEAFKELTAWICITVMVITVCQNCAGPLH